MHDDLKKMYVKEADDIIKASLVAIENEIIEQMPALFYELHYVYEATKSEKIKDKAFKAWKRMKNIAAESGVILVYMHQEKGIIYPDEK